ncbi:MAG TPA: hypothetical protein VK325_04230 [Pseudoxanthomonas sp.]|nr:hypothetical protein [Pseudoxanthomonas sp.]
MDRTGHADYQRRLIEWWHHENPVLRGGVAHHRPRNLPIGADLVADEVPAVHVQAVWALLGSGQEGLRRLLRRLQAGLPRENTEYVLRSFDQIVEWREDVLAELAVPERAAILDAARASLAPPPVAFSSGDRVRAARGLWKGLPGTVMAVDADARRLTVRLTVLGRELPVTLDEADLEIDGGSE